MFKSISLTFASPPRFLIVIVSLFLDVKQMWNKYLKYKQS